MRVYHALKLHAAASKERCLRNKPAILRCSFCNTPQQYAQSCLAPLHADQHRTAQLHGASGNCAKLQAGS